MAERKIESVNLNEVETIDRESWDVLIILDACRYDLYQEVVGEGEKIISSGGNTAEFLEKNFSNTDWSNTIYISGCHFAEKQRFEAWVGEPPDDTFKNSITLHKEAWDAEKKTVVPGPIKEQSLQRIGDAKKVIIHFMQPHHPFIPKEYSIDVAGAKAPGSQENHKLQNIWELGEYDEVGKEEIWQGYKANLDYVMEHVRELVEELDGKVVVTSDHGNLVGERGLYGHSYGSKAKKVREVPWHVIQDE
jgi:arylsulfatase A-like enzyme